MIFLAQGVIILTVQSSLILIFYETLQLVLLDVWTLHPQIEGVSASLARDKWGIPWTFLLLYDSLGNLVITYLGI